MVDRKLDVLQRHMKELSVAREEGNRREEGLACFNLGNYYDGVADFREAIRNYTEALSIFKEIGLRAEEGRAFGHLGNTHHSLGNFKQAIEYHNQNLSIAKEVGDRAGVGIAYCNLGSAYNSLGNFKQALEYHQQSLGIAKEVGDRAGEGRTYCNLGNAYQSLGNFKQAIEYHNQDLSIAKEVGNRAGEGRAYGNLGNVYQSLGNFKQAIEYHHQDLRIAKEIGDKVRVGIAYGNIGSAYNSLGNFKQALEYHQPCLDIAKKVGNRASEGRAYGNLANVYQSLGNFKQAIEYHNQDLSIAKEVGDRAGEGRAYGNLGYAYHKTGDLVNALSFNEQHLSICKEMGDPIGEGIACYRLGLDHEILGSLSKAIYYYRLSISCYDETRRHLHSEVAWKISFHDTNQSVYAALWRALLKNGEVDEALYAAEQGRAQALTDILKVRYHSDGEPSSAVTTKETISSLLEYLPSQTVFTALEGNTISFWILKRGSEVKFKQKEIENGSADSLMKTTFEEQIGAGICNCLKPLYDVLIGPIADLLHGDDLIFVPDGPFCLAPFSALSDTVRIRTVPSLTALKLITNAPDDFNIKNEMLLVGDPWLKEVTYGTDEPMYDQLPGAKREVEMVGKLLQTEPLAGISATKAEVLKRMKSAALIHIAAHGDDKFEEIALAPNPERTSQIPEEEDYMLTMNDVQQLHLQARLVVLSCSHSGQGEVKAEGVVGIARAFLCAGARSVLVSIWAIDDEATLLFMNSFYQHLADRKSASLALHHAMKSLRETEDYSAIKYWAPFVLIGDDVTFEFGPQQLQKNGKCFSNICALFIKTVTVHAFNRQVVERNR